MDRNGKIIAEPITGAEVGLYEKHIEDALNGIEIPQTKRTNYYENSDNCYRIKVVDEDMKPVEGAMVQFCSDENCNMGVTGSDGTVTFDNPPGIYEVHVRKVPEGYDVNTSTYRTADHYSDMVIVVEKK